eukprot:m.625054 g.625054  ORF g.625054 m.625054 type:complete len:315 (+) comp22546_c0_seq29:161-1105(+)
MAQSQNSNDTAGKNDVMYAVKSFFTGMMSAQVAALCTNPIDVVKIRLQIQGEGGGGAAGLKPGGSRGLLNMFVHIARTEGILSLQKGIVPSLLRETSYSSIRLSLYEPIRDRIMTEDEKKHGAPLLKKFLAGATSGAIGSGLANPADLVKVRMQAATGHTYTSTWSAFKEIWQLEGLRGLYRGTVPTMKRAAILTATQLGTYDHVKQGILKSGLLHEGVPLHFCSGVIAGFAVAVTTSPVDTVRTRLMNQPLDAAGRGTLYRGMSDCALQTIRAEGFLGIYKGFTAQWMRVGPHTTISLVTWEFLRRLSGVSAI